MSISLVLAYHETSRAGRKQAEHEDAALNYGSGDGSWSVVPALVEAQSGVEL